MPRQQQLRSHGTSPDDRGSAAAELTLFTPVLIMIMLLSVAAGRLVSARLKVDDAAHQAARAASTARTPAAAQQAATAAAHAAILQGNVACERLDVHTDTSAFRAGGRVTVQITCPVSLRDLGLLDIPGTKSLEARGTAPVDLWRASTTDNTAWQSSSDRYKKECRWK